MEYNEKKRSLFLGLPWTLTRYHITDELISESRGLIRKVEDDCFMYKVEDVRLEISFLERILKIGTISCYTADNTTPNLMIRHVKKAREIKDFILKASEADKRRRGVVQTQHLNGRPGMGPRTNAQF